MLFLSWQPATVFWKGGATKGRVFLKDLPRNSISLPTFSLYENSVSGHKLHPLLREDCIVYSRLWKGEIPDKMVILWEEIYLKENSVFPFSADLFGLLLLDCSSASADWWHCLWPQEEGWWPYPAKQCSRCWPGVSGEQGDFNAQNQQSPVSWARVSGTLWTPLFAKDQVEGQPPVCPISVCKKHWYVSLLYCKLSI